MRDIEVTLADIIEREPDSGILRLYDGREVNANRVKWADEPTALPEDVRSAQTFQPYEIAERPLSGGVAEHAARLALGQNKSWPDGRKST